MNLGSPDTPAVADVKRYLMEFLMDKRVIDYPYLFRKFLVGGIIVPTRAEKSAEAYKTIWTKDGSPLIDWTRQLSAALQLSVPYPVTIAMRYGNPSMKAAFDELSEKVNGLEEVLAIPMYPHYAMSSYETAVEHAKDIHQKNHYPFGLRFVRPFYEDPSYIQAMSGRIGPYLQRPYDHILFSFHGIPERHLVKADPTASHCLKSARCCQTDSAAHASCYRHQCLQTMELVARGLQIPEKACSYSFQSRLGKEQWLRPYTDFRLKEMPDEGIKKLLIVCPAFVSDCLETLEEIEIRGRDIFLTAGGETFEMIPCLNTSGSWVSAMASWILRYQQGDQQMLLA